MKIKQIPEDFIVEEISDNKLTYSGEHQLFLLEKKGLETFAVLKLISRLNGNIPLPKIGLAGIKDKNAITKQYITIPKNYPILHIKERNFQLTPIGLVKKKLQVGDLTRNKFIIVVRDLKKEIKKEEILPILKDIKEYGFINYFDTQRFGSVEKNGFIIKEVMKKNYTLALALLRKNLTNDKLLLKEQNTPFLKLYAKVPKGLKEMFVFAYQSYLWNECVSELLKQNFKSENLIEIKYELGNFIFIKGIKDKNNFNLLDKSFPLLSPNVILNEKEEKIVSNILKKEGITLKQLDISETGCFFKAYPRNIIVKPINFNMSELEIDELNKERQKVTLSFELPKGCYATLIVKMLFS